MPIQRIKNVKKIKSTGAPKKKKNEFKKKRKTKKKKRWIADKPIKNGVNLKKNVWSMDTDGWGKRCVESFGVLVC